MIQAAEGALGEIHGILQRMRELAVQGSSQTLSANDRTVIGLELTQLTAALSKISANATFNDLICFSYDTGQVMVNSGH